MDEILAKASNQAMSFAIRSGISIASGFAIKTVSKFLDRIPKSEKARIEAAKLKLRTKINIVSSSIDLIKLEAARGDSALEPTLQLVNDLKIEIDGFDDQMNSILENFDRSNEKDLIKQVESIINSLILSINDAIPLINLSLITCGVSFTSSLNPKVSPSRLLQSTCLLVDSNKEHAKLEGSADVIVGPEFDLKFYTVFFNPSRLKYIEEDDKSVSSSFKSDPLLLAISWKEEYARALCKLVRSKGLQYSYQLIVQEDFDDNRYHDELEKPKVRKIRIEDIRKQFFSASGRLLRLEGVDSPVLTLKIKAGDGFDYVGFGEAGTDFDDSELETSSSDYEDAEDIERSERAKTLSLLEYLLRLSLLQHIENQSVLEINDEKLSYYLSSQSDGSVLPKSVYQKAIEADEKKGNAQSLQLDSNINRLEHLSLGEK